MIFEYIKPKNIQTIVQFPNLLFYRIYSTKKQKEAVQKRVE